MPAKKTRTATHAQKKSVTRPSAPSAAKKPAAARPPASAAPAPSADVPNAIGTHAKVVMPKTANAARVEACRALGAEVVLTPDMASAFARQNMIRESRDRISLSYPPVVLRHND